MPAGRSLILSPRTSASAEEAAAIVAAIERFMRATAPPLAEPAGGAPDGWRRAALLEGISREQQEQDVAWMFPASG